MAFKSFPYHKIRLMPLNEFKIPKLLLKIKNGIYMKPLYTLILSLFLLGIAACSNTSDPGPLAGKWQLTGQVDMTISFRPGETEANGVIEKVHYKIEGKDVLVTYLEGMAKGMTMRYTLIDDQTAITNLGTLKKRPPNENSAPLSD